MKALPNTPQKTAYILKDDSASDMFIDRQLANKLIKDGTRTWEAGWMQVHTSRWSQDPGIERWMKVYVTLIIDGYQISAWFTIFNITDYDVILGKTWSIQHNLNHEINHTHNILTISSGNNAVVLQDLRPWEPGKLRDRVVDRLAKSPRDKLY